jgi:hypothetical protein
MRISEREAAIEAERGQRQLAIATDASIKILLDVEIDLPRW